jgi:hypothetical protein
MSRTRLAAALGVAALTLGATVAAADNTQTVTIEVQAAARSVTVGGSTVEFTAAVGATGVSASNSDTSSVSYTNPAGNEPAKIEVSRDDTDLGALTLSVVSSVAPGDEGQGEGGAATAVAFTSTAGDAADFITDISAGAEVTGRSIVFTLGGNAPSTEDTITTNFTFTITDQDF